jgi:hypothetical protein
MLDIRRVGVIVVVVGRAIQLKFPSVSQFRFVAFLNFIDKQACLEILVQ